MKLVILHKAKYIKRWKGKDGKWNYQYTENKPKHKKVEVEPPKFDYRIPVKTRKQMRKTVQEVLKPTYFKEIPVTDISNSLHKYGYRLSDEEGNEWNGILLGDDSRALFDISNMNGVIQKNTKLQLNWYKMNKRNGGWRYEVTGYIT